MPRGKGHPKPEQQKPKFTKREKPRLLEGVSDDELLSGFHTDVKFLFRGKPRVRDGK